MARTSRPKVEFAQAVQSIRAPREDERSVMRHFSNHAGRCHKCADPYQTFKSGGELCDKGHSLARDVATYIYSRGARPHSMIDRENGDRIELEIPVAYEVIRNLVKAFDRGLNLKTKKKPAPIVSQDKSYYVKPRGEHYYDRQENANVIEVTPGSNRKDRRERDRYSREEREDRDRRRYSDSKGSLYRRDEEAKQARRRYEEEPVIIYAEPSRRYRR